MHETASSNGLCWIASYPKSGNTYVRLLVDAFLYGRVDINRLRTASDSMPALIQPALPFAWSDLNDKAIVKLRSVACLWALHYAKITGHPYIKSHWVAGGVPDVIPYPADLTHKMVYLVRNPLDVAASLSRHLGITPRVAINVMAASGFQTPTEMGRKILTQFWGSWNENLISHWGNSEVDRLIVRYEDLLQDPVKTFSAIVSHFGIEGVVSIEEAVELADINRAQEQEREAGFGEAGRASRFFTDPRKDKWKTILSTSEEKAVLRLYRDLPGYIRKVLNYA